MAQHVANVLNSQFVCYGNTLMPSNLRLPLPNLANKVRYYLDVSLMNQNIGCREKMRNLCIFFFNLSACDTLVMNVRLQQALTDMPGLFKVGSILQATVTHWTC